MLLFFHFSAVKSVVNCNMVSFVRTWSGDDDSHLR